MGYNLKKYTTRNSRLEYVPSKLFTNNVKVANAPVDGDILSFINELTDVYKQYVLLNFKSTGKDKEEYLHDIIKHMIKKHIAPFNKTGRYLVMSKTRDVSDVNSTYGEYHLDDKLGGKNIDITIFDTVKNRPVVFINCKFPLLSYGKNTYNYLENLIGESRRIKKAAPDVGLFYFYSFVSKIPIPKDDDKKINKFDEIGERELEKYNNAFDEGLAISDGTFICIVDDSLDDEFGTCTTLKDFVKLHKKDFSLSLADNQDGKVYENIIYNDIKCFIKRILNYIEEYENI